MQDPLTFYFLPLQPEVVLPHVLSLVLNQVFRFTSPFCVPLLCCFHMLIENRINFLVCFLSEGNVFHHLHHKLIKYNTARKNIYTYTWKTSNTHHVTSECMNNSQIQLLSDRGTIQTEKKKNQNIYFLA